MEKFELLDASINCFNNPPVLGDASGLIRFRCGALSSIIDERCHSYVQLKALHHTDSIPESSVNHSNIVLGRER
jgi:hypothetical protein